jgi:hypothetical protein
LDELLSEETKREGRDQEQRKSQKERGLPVHDETAFRIQPTIFAKSFHVFLRVPPR